MNIHDRFKALPRARRGTTTVVIVDEAVLAELIGDAQASEAALFSGHSSRPIATASRGRVW